MAFSTLYSAIIRGKWFLSFKEIEGNLLLVDKFLKRDFSASENMNQSDKEPLKTSLVKEGRRSGDNFSDAKPGSVAVIPLHGTMLKYDDMCSYGTETVASYINEAVASNNISGIVLDIHSGGGAVDAIAPLATAIRHSQAAGKPVVALCDLCASAAYYVASYCDEIIAANDISSEFGSIGVMCSFADYAKYYEDQGIKVHTIYSSLSDHKNLAFELARKGEYDKIRTEELDPLARQFQSAVRNNRKNLNDKVEGILSGKMFYSKEAIANGLADSSGDLLFAVDRVNEISREAKNMSLISKYIG